MKVASLVVLSLLIAVIQGVQSNSGRRPEFMGAIEHSSSYEDAPQMPRNFPGSAFDSPTAGKFSGLPTPADRVKAASQGRLRQRDSVQPRFAPGQPAIFTTYTTFPSGGVLSESMVARDLNGDGKLDLVIANECTDSTCTAGSVSVLLGNGDGTFQPAVTYKAPYFPNIVAIADLNGDGKLDIVAGTYCGNGDTTCLSSSATVLLGNGDGTFQAGLGYAAGSYVSSVAVGDLNGDGKPDIVTDGCFDSICGNVAVLLGNGDGTFQAAMTYGSGGASSVAIGDLNGDGKPDLAVINNGGGAEVLLGNGDGTFAETFSVGGFVAFSVVVADVNGDGKLDLVTANPCITSTNGCPSGAVGVLLGNGDGTFQNATIYSSGGVYAHSVVVVDVNGDGKADVVLGNTFTPNGPGSNAAVLFGNGDGTFQSPVSYESGPGNAPSVVPGDVNGDGIIDLLVVADAVDSNDDGAVNVLLGIGGGKFASAATYVPAGLGSNALVVADLNGDGNPDLVYGNRLFSDACCYSGVGVSLGNADGTFPPGVGYSSLGYNPDYTAVEVADVNGDGKPDILVADQCFSQGCYASAIAVLLGNGDGTFKPAVAYRTRIMPPSFAVADINGDGKPDVVALSQYGVEGMLGKGDGTFEPQVTLSSDGIGASYITVADVNGDGKPDILAVTECVDINLCVTGSVGVLLGNGDGTFQPEVSYDSGGLQAVGFVIGDINGDGKPDLLIQNNFGYSGTMGAIGVLLGNGDGTFQAATSWPTLDNTYSYFAEELVIADFNGDGKMDVVSGSQDSLLLGNGDGTFQAPILLPGGSYGVYPGYGTAVADFNHDGKPDLAVGSTTILLNISPGGATAVVSPTSVNFGNQTVGKGSAKQTVTLSNTGTAALNLSSIAASATNGSVVIQTNNCGASVAAGASCAVTLAWIPSATGTMTGSLTFTDNAANSPQVVALSGVGVSPAVTLSPAKLVFHTQVVFTTSPSQTATLTNTGLGTLGIAKISVSGPFLQTNTCGKSVVAGASCTFTVTFKPTTIGKSTGDISITDNAGNSPQTVAVSGFGTYVMLAPTSLNFGNQAVGTKSLPKRVTLSNKGSVAVNITGISFTGTNATDFAETNTCGTSVAAGASCSITVTFTPSATGNRTATLSVTDDGGASPQTVSVAGTGT